MSAHTPGPWVSCQLGRGVLVGPRIGFKVGNVAVVYGGYGETAANVALIEAAPDLLRACETALRMARYDLQRAERDEEEAYRRNIDEAGKWAAKRHTADARELVAQLSSVIVKARGGA